MGISLHFIPRLASFPLPSPERSNWILWLMAPGLFLRVVGGTVLASLTGSPIFVPLSWLVVASGLLEGGAIVLYISLLIGTIRGSNKAIRLPGLSAVKPYLSMMAGSAAAICRVAPLLAPSWLFDLLPAGGVPVQTTFAISGLLGWGAVLCLAANLRQTAVCRADLPGDHGWGSCGAGGMERRSY